MYRLLVFFFLFAFASPAWSQTVADSIRADWNEIGLRLARIITLMEQVERDTVFVSETDTIEVVRVDTVEIGRIDTVFIPQEPVERPIPDRSSVTLEESQFFQDSTGYEIYVQGIDTLVALYDTSSSLHRWYAFHGDFVTYQLHPGATEVKVPRLFWDLALDDRYRGEGENRGLDVWVIKEHADFLRGKEDLAGLVWSPGQDVDLGPAVLGDSFRVELAITPESFNSWQRLVGKSGGPSPVHWWLVEISPLGEVWFRVRLEGELVSVMVPGLELNQRTVIEAEYTGTEIILTVDGQTQSLPVVGTRDETSAYHVWVWVEGAPDHRVFFGTIEYVRIFTNE